MYARDGRESGGIQCARYGTLGLNFESPAGSPDRKAHLSRFRTFRAEPLSPYRQKGFSRGIPMLKVLIAEDELLIADQIEETLLANGYEVCGIARTVDEGVELGELHKPDLAVLDLRLAKGTRGPDIVRRLNGRANFGVLYATGNDSKSSPLTIENGDALIAKPFRADELLRALTIVWEISREGTATPPFPRGFRLLPGCLARYDRGAPA